MESWTQGSRPRPRTQKNFEAKDQGHRRKCSPKKKVFKIFFQATSKKGLQKFFSSEKGLQKFFFRRFPLEENKKGLCKFSARFLALSNKISTVQKIVLSSSRGQGNFRGLEASRPRSRTSNCVLENVLEDSTSGLYSCCCKKYYLKLTRLHKHAYTIISTLK